MQDSTTTLLHVSDIHMGHVFLPAVGDALVEAARAIAPDATVISGDYVQRGDFVSCWRDARAYVERLPAPRIGVPGNHDIPLWNPLRRALSPFARYREFICRDLEPVLEVEGAVIAGICTPRPWIVDLGRVSEGALERVAARFAAAPAGALRVAVMHHPLLPQAECRVRHHVYGWRTAIARLAAAGADVVLSGHNHYPKHVRVADHVEGAGDLVLAQAGTATSNRLRRPHICDAQSVNVLRARPGALEVERWSYRGGRFAPDGTTRFERSVARDAARSR